MAALKESGTIVCLKASVEAVLERTQARGTRPVLDGADKGDRRAAVEKLLQERAALYEQADFAVDTSNLSPLQVVENITKTLKIRGVLHA
jgi:shikimate kinase